MRVSIQLRIAAIVAAVWLAGANVGRSQNVFDYTNAGGDNLWNNPANWTGGPAGTFPNGQNDTARFIGLTGAIVVLNIPVTAHIESVNSQVSISGTGSLTLPPASAPQVVLEVANVGVDVGILAMGVPVEFTGPTTFRVNAVDPTFSGLGLTFLADVTSNGHGLTIVGIEDFFGEGTNVTFQGNYNTGDVYVDGPIFLQTQQTFQADTITLSHGFMRTSTANANVVANQFKLIGGVFSDSGADNSLSNVTGPVVSEGGFIASGLVVPGLHIGKGWTFIQTFQTGANAMQLGDVTREACGAVNFFIGGSATILADSVEGVGPGGVIPYGTVSGNDFAKFGSGQISAVTTYVALPSATAADAALVSSTVNLTGNEEAFVVKMLSGRLNGANNTVATNAWLFLTTASDPGIFDATLVPLDNDELIFHAVAGSRQVKFNNVNVADTPAGPTKVIFAGAGQATINDSWSKTGDTYLIGPFKLNLGPNADLGGNMLTLLSDSDGFTAHDVRLNNGADLTQHVHVQSSPLPSPVEPMFTIQGGDSAMTGDMMIDGNSANDRAVNLLVQAGASLTHSGAITRSGTGNPIAGQGQAVLRVSGQGTMNFAATFDSTDAGVTTTLSGTGGQQVVVDGALGKTVVGDSANVEIRGGGSLGSLGAAADAITPPVLVVAPGGSIGTLTVQGDMLLRTSTFTYEAEVTDTGQSDRLAVGGTLDLSTPSDTLDISFFAGSTLADANYTLGTYGALVGIFDAVRFAGAPIADPTAAGAFGGTHQLIYGASALLLATGPVAGVPGDYNGDGKVDAADYVVWRKNEGTTNVLPNDPIGGTIGAAHYNQWRTNFGAMGGAGSGDSASADGAVPEPATMLLLLLAALVAGLFMCRVPRFRRLSSNAPTN